jgi:hypothetical protein
VTYAAVSADARTVSREITLNQTQPVCIFPKSITVPKVCNIQHAYFRKTFGTFIEYKEHK